MYRQIDVLRFGQGPQPRAPSRRTIGDRVTGDVQLALLVTDTEQHLVHRVVQVEQPDVRLQRKFRVRSQVPQVGLRQLGLDGSVKRFDFRPLQPYHIEGYGLHTGNVLGMRAQPGLQP